MSVELTRVTLNVTPGAKTALDTAIKLGDHRDKTDAINTAIKVYADLLTAVADGGQVTVVGADGTTERWRL